MTLYSLPDTVKLILYIFLNFKNARVLVYAEFMMLFLQNSLKPEVYENGTQFLLNLKKIVKRSSNRRLHWPFFSSMFPSFFQIRLKTV